MNEKVTIGGEIPLKENFYFNVLFHNIPLKSFSSTIIEVVLSNATPSACKHVVLRYNSSQYISLFFFI